MSTQEKPAKVSKLLRVKAQEFLSSRRHSDNLVDIVKHFSSGADLTSCMLALELVFTHLLKEKEMVIEIVPLKPLERTPEMEYKEWLRNIYEECFTKILNCCEHGCGKIQVQGEFTSAFLWVALLLHRIKIPVLLLLYRSSQSFTDIIKTIFFGIKYDLYLSW